MFLLLFTIIIVRGSSSAAVVLQFSLHPVICCHKNQLYYSYIIVCPMNWRTLEPLSWSDAVDMRIAWALVGGPQFDGYRYLGTSGAKYCNVDAPIYLWDDESHGDNNADWSDYPNLVVEFLLIFLLLLLLVLVVYYIVVVVTALARRHPKWLGKWEQERTRVKFIKLPKLCCHFHPLWLAHAFLIFSPAESSDPKICDT